MSFSSLLSAIFLHHGIQNEQQQEAADNLVKMIDLAPNGAEDVLQPDLIPNPVLERFYCHLELKTQHPDAAVPPL